MYQATDELAKLSTLTHHEIIVAWGRIQGWTAALSDSLEFHEASRKHSGARTRGRGRSYLGFDPFDGNKPHLFTICDDAERPAVFREGGTSSASEVYGFHYNPYAAWKNLWETEGERSGRTAPRLQPAPQPQPDGLYSPEPGPSGANGPPYSPETRSERARRLQKSKAKSRGKGRAGRNSRAKRSKGGNGPQSRRSRSASRGSRSSRGGRRSAQPAETARRTTETTDAASPSQEDYSDHIWFHRGVFEPWEHAPRDQVPAGVIVPEGQGYTSSAERQETLSSGLSQSRRRRVKRWLKATGAGEAPSTSQAEPAAEDSTDWDSTPDRLRRGGSSSRTGIAGSARSQSGIRGSEPSEPTRRGNSRASAANSEPQIPDLGHEPWSSDSEPDFASGRWDGIRALCEAASRISVTRDPNCPQESVVEEDQANQCQGAGETLSRQARGQRKCRTTAAASPSPGPGSSQRNDEPGPGSGQGHPGSPMETTESSSSSPALVIAEDTECSKSTDTELSRYDNHDDDMDGVY